MLKVWDRPVRVLHGVLAASVALAWATTFAWFGWHQAAGWIALAAVLLRAVWGFAGSHYARFAQFVRTPLDTLRYMRLLLHGREPRYLGHNPLGGWMAIALMLCVAGLALTGWLYTTERWWGDEQVEQVHRALAWLLLGLVAMHVAGVVFTSFRHRENLLRAMCSGAKNAPREDDVA